MTYCKDPSQCMADENYKGKISHVPEFFQIIKNTLQVLIILYLSLIFVIFAKIPFVILVFF